MTRFVMVIFLTVCMFASGCGDSAPSVSEIENQVAALHAKAYNGKLYDVVKVEKTNGILDKATGIYTAETKVTLRFKMDFKNYAIARMKGVQPLDFFTAAEREVEIDEMKGSYGVFKAGEEKTAIKSHFFQKTEKGWLLFTL